jgi:hypothetical protein
MSNVESTTTATRPTPSATPELPANPQDLPSHPLADEHAMGDSHEQRQCLRLSATKALSSRS